MPPPPQWSTRKNAISYKSAKLAGIGWLSSLLMARVRISGYQLVATVLILGMGIDWTTPNVVVVLLFIQRWLPIPVRNEYLVVRLRRPTNWVVAASARSTSRARNSQHDTGSQEPANDKGFQFPSQRYPPFMY